MTAMLDRITGRDTDVKALVPTHTGTMFIASGPLKGSIEWDTADEESVAMASTKFAEAKALGMLGYETKAGSDPTVTRTFDKEADAVTFTSQLVGG